MDELVKSVLRFTWAMSLFGIGQLSSALSPASSDQQESAAAAFDSVTHAAEQQLGDSTKLVFQAGDQLQRGMLDLMFNLLTPQTFTPSGMMRVTLDVMQQSAAVLSLIAPSRENRLAWQEFENKLQSFNLFERVDQVCGLLSETAEHLPELVERADALGPYVFVWATEGLGHYYAEAVWEQRGEPRNLLTGDDARRLPAKSMAALHAGMGLAFANRVLEPIKSPGSTDDIGQALRRFISLCQENSTPCYVGASYEALGLVARNLYPQFVQSIDRLLTEIREDLSCYFWHGVGRAIYFAPTNFLPRSNSSRQAVEMTQQEPPHEDGRRNALAGLAWAMTLVNIRQPEILESFLRHHGARLPDGEAFANGVGSALIIWRDSTEDDPFLQTLCQYQPKPSDSRLLELWANFVWRPAEEALQRAYPVLKRDGSLGEVFRYQSLAGLIERLEREEQTGAARTGATQA